MARTVPSGEFYGASNPLLLMRRLKVHRRGFIAKCAALAFAAGIPNHLPEARVLPSEDRRGRISCCLFLDDTKIDHMQGLEVQGHPAKRYACNPLFVRKYFWEKTGLQLYGRSIVYNPERKLYQTFYLAQPNLSHWPNVRVGWIRKVGFVTLPAYAESGDGVHGKRPLRRDVPFDNINETNLLDLVSGKSYEPSVMYDPHDADPNRRYKAFIWDQNFELPLPGKLDYRRAKPSLSFPRGLLISQIIRDKSGKTIYEKRYNDYGIRVAFSPDGIHWKKHPGWAFRCYSDTG